MFSAKVKVGTGDVMERFWSPSPNNGFSHRRYEWSGFCFLQVILKIMLLEHKYIFVRMRYSDQGSDQGSGHKYFR